MHLCVIFTISRAFNIGAVVELETDSDERLSPNDVIPALQTLVSRHNALRSRVLPSDSATQHVPIVITKEEMGDFEVVTLSDNQKELRLWAVEEIRKPFNLSSQLFRFSLLQRDCRSVSLCVSFHHIAVDGASLHALLLELLALVSHCSLSPTPPQLTSFLPQAASTRSSVQQAKRERVVKSWVNLLGPAESCTRLYHGSSDSSQNEKTSCRFSECVALKCPQTISTAVREIASFFNVSETVVLTSVFVVAVSSLLKEGRVVIGCASENRRRAQRGMVGHTVNLLPLRVDIPQQEEIDLSDVISQVNEGWALIMEGGVTLGELVNVLPCLKAGAAPSGLPSNKTGLEEATPLQVIFSFLPLPQKKLPEFVSLASGAKVRCKVHLPRSCDAQADLFLEVRAPGNWEGNEAAKTSHLFTWEYRAPLRGRIPELHSLTVSTLTSAAAAAHSVARDGGERRLCLTNLEVGEDFAAEEFVVSKWEVPSVDTHQPKSSAPQVIEHMPQPFIWSWPGHAPSDCQPQCLKSSQPLQGSVAVGKFSPEASLKMGGPSNQTPIEMIMRKARESLDKPALSFEGKTLTYHQLTSEIERLAGILVKRGVAPGNHVSLLLPRCLQLYTSLLAILRCGAAYVPLSLHHPETSLLLMLQTAAVRTLITDSATLKDKFPCSHDNNIPGFHGDCICVDSDISSSDYTQFDVRYHSYQIAYIIFTSGTTGAPKAVAITNESLSHFLINFTMLATPDDTEVTVAGATVAWDGHVIDSLGPLINGSCLVISPPLVIPEGATFAFMSPSAASVVKFPTSMRCLLVGGEAFTQTCYRNIKNIPKIMSAYGPTETTVFVSAEIILDSENVEKSFSCLGKPLPGTVLMVCDAEQCAVPLEREGELYIAGSQVSRVGYYKNETKTKSCFLSLPNYGLVYKTGDWVKMTSDGNIVFLGRVDDQVKLRGMRFQLHEVEATLTCHPTVQTTAVAVRNPGTSSAQLLGFVTPANIDLDSIFAFLHSHLPGYMVPSSIHRLDTLPLKSEGKVDRKKLLSLSLSVSEPREPRERVETEIEISSQTNQFHSIEDVSKKLATIFGQVLGLDTYSPTSDFFTSGGQSLLLFQLLHQVRSELGCRLELSDLLHNFHNLSPLSLAHHLVPQLASENTPQLNTTSGDAGGINGKPLDMQGCLEEDLSKKLTGESETKTEFSSDGSDGNQEPGKVESSEVGSSEMGEFDYLAPVPAPTTNEFLEQLLGNLRSGELSAQEASQRLERESGVSISPSSLERYTDTHSLMTQLKLKRLLDYLANTTSPVIKLRPPISNVDDDKPFVFVHGGIIGWPLPYISLSRSIPRSSIAVQRCDSSPTGTFEDMCGYYVDAVVKAQPNGPYRLVGVCYGAMMVYEMARQLTDRGERVELAVLVNHSPAVERLPRIFDREGKPLSGTFVDPAVFFRKVLGLQLCGCEGVRRGGCDEGLVDIVRGVITEIKSSLESDWIPFTAEELEHLYLGFFLRLRCAWKDYIPRPGAAITRCLLLRDHAHPLFKSRDFGLGGLVSSETQLRVCVSPVKMGLMSDPSTLQFVTQQILASLESDI